MTRLVGLGNGGGRSETVVPFRSARNSRDYPLLRRVRDEDEGCRWRRSKVRTTKEVRENILRV